jgi:hypothetical protein
MFRAGQRGNKETEIDKRQKTRDAYLAVIAAVPGTAGALVDRDRIALLHRPLHRCQHLSVSRLCSRDAGLVPSERDAVARAR